MHRIWSDVVKNCLHIELRGSIRHDEADSMLDEVVSEVARLKKGFDVVTDLSQLSISEIASALSLKAIVEYLSIRGVGRVVRVLGRSKAAMMQFMRAFQKVQKYEVKYVASIEAAEEYLADAHDKSGSKG